MSNEDVARAWRQHADETPPADVDAAILAAAHRAVGSGPGTLRRAAWARSAPRWWAPLAAAATVGAIALGVLQLAPRDDDDAFAPAPARVAEVNVTPERAAATSPGPAALASSQPARSALSEPALPAAAQRVPLAPFQPAPPALSERALPPSSDQAMSAPSVGRVARQAMATAKPNTTTPTDPAQPMMAQPSPPPPGAGNQTAREPLAQGAVTKQEAAATAAPAPASSGGFVPDAPATAADTGATMAQRIPEPSRADNASKLQTPTEVPRESAAVGGAARDMATEPRATTANAYGSAMRETTTVPKAAPARAHAGAQERETNLRSPEAFTTRIAALRKEGNDAAAASELRAFRMAYPDADRRLPPEWRDWAATIKP